MNDIATLTIKVDAKDGAAAEAILKKLTDQGEKTAKSTDVVTEAFSRLIKILGPAALVSALTLAVKGALQLQDSYVRLSEIAGTTASKMSSFDLAARLSGTSMDTVAQSIARLGKAIGEARLGDVEKQGIFKALGIDPNDGRDAADIMVDVSKAVMGMKDQNVAAAVSQTLLSRGFAEMRPFMKQIVEQGELNARVTDEQAAKAKEFMDAVETLKFELQDQAIAVARDLLPVLRTALNVYRDLKNDVNATEGVVTVAKVAFKGLASVVLVASDAVFQLGRTIGGIAAMLVAFAEKDYKRAGVIFATTLEDIVKNTEKTIARVKALWAENGGALMPPAVKDTGGGGNSEAEAAVRARMLFLKTYDQRVADAKAFYDNYANAIKIGNSVVEAQQQAGVISQEDAIRQTQLNENARLEVLRLSLEEQRKLHEQKGDLAKASEAKGQIDQIGAQQIANEVIANARIEAIRTEARGKFLQDLAQRSADIQLQQMTELQQLEHHYLQRQATIDLAVAEQIISDDQWQAQSALNYAAYEAEKTRIADEEAKKRYGISQVHHKLDLDSTRTFLGYMQGLMNSKSRELFEIGKAAAIGGAIIDTYKAATGAYASLSSIPIVGPALGAAAAAAAVVAGLANVQQIRAQKFGGSGVATPTFPASPTTGLPVGSPTPDVRQPNARGGGLTVIKVQGDIIGKETLRNIMERISEESVDGGRVVVE